ncbi:DUF4397 domain-containing protein [Halopseudomonas salegens]|uniref:DUF4397 domain-containing protein n=1 Tax=Halopseudomonas salegens TaxID=1434072 RepID=A0A1H2H0F7_9GAMM|nr:DUF4397 domain-containing protein [Halopseudomonas salegens]SDU25340.1 protein of unknown function [Halopseudomonas salegens]
MRALTLFLVATAIILSGCLGGSGGSSSTPVPPAGASADVRVLHAAADAPSVDIYINDELAIPDLARFEATSFTSVPAELLTIDVRASGSPADSAPVFSSEVTPTADGFFTLVAYGLLDDDSFDLLVIADDIQTPPTDTARAFVLHAAPATGNVDVYVDATDELGAEPLLADFAPAADSADYVEVPAGDYRIRITPAGDRDTIAYDSGFVSLESGPSYFLAALDRASGFAPASVIALLDNPSFVQLEDQRTRVRAMHLSPDAPNVDVLVDGAAAVPDVAFRDVSDYLTVLAGEYDIAVAAGGNEVASLTVNAEAGVAYSILATGFVSVTGEQGFALRPLVDDLTPGEGAKVRVIHASPDAPNVDVLVNGAMFAGLAGVPYFTASDYVEAPADTYDIAVNVADTLTTVIDLPGTGLNAGSNYTVIAINDVANIEPLLVVDP